MSEIIQQQQSRMSVARDQITRLMPEMQKVAASDTSVPRIARTIMSALSAAQKPNGRNALLEADAMSLHQAAMTACQLGLEVDGITGQGYLVPFKGKVQFMPGYKGLITLAFRAGFIVEGHCVYENDLFSYHYGLDPMCNHAPAQSGQERGRLVATYATARSRIVPSVFRVMEMGDITKIRDGSAGYRGMGNSSPWATHFEVMAMKSAVRAVAGRLPQLSDASLMKALRLEPTEDGVTALSDEGEIIDIEGAET
jgi:recombination protein RecT